MIKPGLTTLMICVSCSILFFLTCGTQPINPLEDPGKVTIKVISKNGPTLVQGQQVPISIFINIPKLVRKIEIDFGINDSGDTIISYTNSATKPDTINLTGKFLSAETKKVTATATLSNGLLKVVDLTLNVIEKPLSIHFDMIPVSHSILVQANDTMNFSAKTNPAGGVILFTAISLPLLDTNSLKTIATGSNAMLIFNSSVAGKYTIKIHAQSGITRDSAAVEITVYNKPSFVDQPKILILQPGIIDTLHFIAKHDSTDSLAITFLNQSEFNPDVISIVKSKPETLIVVFKPVKEGIYKFDVQINGKIFNDTLHIERIVKKEEKVIWKQLSTNLNATEGKTIQQDFKAFLSDTATPGLTFTVNKGSLNGLMWQWTIPWGINAIDTVKITAYQNNIPSILDVVLYCTTGDSTPPEIKKIIPLVENDSVSSPQVTCKFSITDKSAGIGNVVFSLDSIIQTDTTHSDSIYQCVVSNLKHGQKAALKVIALDASMRQNACTSFVNITYDSTLLDNLPPVIVQKTGPKPGERTKIATGTISFTVFDKSGLQPVACELNGSIMAGLTNAGDTYTIPFTLTRFGRNFITIHSTDNSAAQNSDSLPIELFYNTEISSVTLISPSNNSTDISVEPTFIWSGGRDLDQDSVYFKVRYGLTPTNLSFQSLEVTDTVVAINSSSLLDSYTKYHWQVIAYSKVNCDSSISEIRSFSSQGIAPEITKQPSSMTVCEDVLAEFSVTAIGTAPLTYQWRTGTSNFTNITGADSSSYSRIINSTDNGLVLSCVVKNAIGTNIASKFCTLTVNTVSTKPAATATPISICQSSSSRLSATGLLGTEAVWKWYTSKTGIALTSPSPTVTPSASTWYFVRSEGGCKNSEWDSVLVLVKAGTSIQTQPASQSKVVGLSATFSVAATGSSPLSYQWKKGEANVTNGIGGTTNSYTITSVIVEDAGNFTCIVTDSCGQLITSSIATLTVIPKYIVKFNTQGGTPIPDTTITSGTKVSIPSPAPARTGYFLEDWYTDSTWTTKWYFTTANVTANVTLYAKWVIKDADGNYYTEIKIGNQIWMAENLKTTKYRNGDTISSVQMKFPDNLESNKNKYGMLYGGIEENNIAPEGWRIPTAQDFEALKFYLKSNGYGYGGVDTAIAKSISSQQDWIGSTVAGSPGNIPSDNNLSNFNAFPAGRYDSYGGKLDIGTFCSFWTSSSDGVQGWSVYYTLSNTSTSLSYNTAGKVGFWMSIRLIKEQ